MKIRLISNDLIDQLGDLLTHQDDHVFEKTISELLPEVTVMDNRSNSMLINFDFQTGTVLIAVDCSCSFCYYFEFFVE